jgi:hypothetical protein
MYQKRLSKLFLSSDLYNIGAKEAPASVAISTHEHQKIAYIPLRLAPPVKIRTLRDARDIILNHEFLRLICVVVWLVLCGFIETFMAQLSDMRYHNSPDISKVSTVIFLYIYINYILISLYKSTPLVTYCTTHFPEFKIHKL